MKYSLISLLFVFGAIGCSDGSDGGSDNELDRGVLQDAERDVYYVDVRRFDLGIGTQPDFGVLPDAAPPKCLSEGAPLTETFTAEPAAGLDRVTGRLRLSDDGPLSLVLRFKEADGYTFQIMSGNPPAEVGQFSVVTTGTTEFMDSASPTNGIWSPVAFGDTSAFYTVTTTEMGLSLTFVDSRDFSVLQTFEQPGEFTSHTLVAGAEFPVLLGNLNDGSCLARSITSEMPMFTRDRCRLAEGWDANGDGRPEIVRYGPAGFALMDSALGEDIAVEADFGADAVGFGRTGPVDLRGQGAEIVTARLDGPILSVSYHDPIELNPIGDPQIKNATNGTYERAVFHMVDGQPRLITAYDRLGVQILQVFEPGDTLRKVAEFGPFRYLSWRVDADVDGDGIGELLVMGGSREDGYNTKLDYRRLRDGSQALEIPAVRSTRFIPAWAAGIVAGPTELDGCDGKDRVTLRSGLPSADGLRSTRLVFHDDEGFETVRSEESTGAVHQIVVTDLDGESPNELVEIRTEDDSSVRLRVYGAPNSSNPASPGE